MFKIKTSNAMALNLSFPLIIVRYPYTYHKDSNAQYVNQFGVKMLTDVQSGIAPVEWQSYEGPVLAYRPQIVGEVPKHFGSLDFSIISEFMKINKFGNETANRNLTLEKLKKFAKNYCVDSTLLQLKEQNILNMEEEF